MKTRTVILALLLAAMVVTAIAPVSAMIPPNPPTIGRSLPDPANENPDAVAAGPAQGGMDGIADQHAHDVTPDDVVSDAVPEWAGVPYH